jgi:hypothetical protein
VDADGPDETGLEVNPSLILYAFELAAPHVRQNLKYETKLATQQSIALGLIDWALEECDRGVKLLEAESELALKRKSGGGSLTILGPFDLG